MIVTFHSDDYTVSSGFSATVSAVINTPSPTSNYCVSRFITLSATGSAILQSPNFPHDYPNNCDCSWRIFAPAGYQVQIHFESFRTETGYDYVTVYDSSSTDKQLEMLVTA